MNIFEQYLDKIKKTLLDFSKKGDLILPDSLDGITAEIPPPKFNSDISTNVAMVLSKINKKPPIELANTLSEEIKKNDKLIDEISVVKPGFINIKLKPIFWTNFIKEIIQNSKSFGINTREKKKNYLIEFVSANPTGPLHVGHGRSAAFGSALSQILRANGVKLHTEYYVNDAGRQMDILATSVWLRYLELHNLTFSLPSNAYRGEYVIAIAQTLYQQYKNQYFSTYL